MFTISFLYDLFQCVLMFRPGNLPRGLPKVDDCGGLSKVDTRPTIRQVLTAICVIHYVIVDGRFWSTKNTCYTLVLALIYN
jgi:hypothetical protein